jgi:hypothetical protein
MFSYSPFHTFPFAKSDATAAVVPNIELHALDLIANFYVTCPRLSKKEEVSACVQGNFRVDYILIRNRLISGRTQKNSIFLSA